MTTTLVDVGIPPGFGVVSTSLCRSAGSPGFAYTARAHEARAPVLSAHAHGGHRGDQLRNERLHLRALSRESLRACLGGERWRHHDAGRHGHRDAGRHGAALAAAHGAAPRLGRPAQLSELHRIRRATPLAQLSCATHLATFAPHRPRRVLLRAVALHPVERARREGRLARGALGRRALTVHVLERRDRAACHDRALALRDGGARARRHAPPCRGRLSACAHADRAREACSSASSA
jgi:hypothetical protein